MSSSCRWFLIDSSETLTKPMNVWETSGPSFHQRKSPTQYDTDTDTDRASTSLKG